MLNVNRLLENSKRSDLHGYNLHAMGRGAVTPEDYVHPTLQKWDPPTPGLCGAVAFGYEIDTPSPVVPVILCGDTPLSLRVVRHRWTPAFCDTYYRSEPMGDYAPAGLLTVRERKCFTADDTFVSELSFSSDDGRPLTLRLSLSVPFSPIGEGLYRVEAKGVPAGLKRPPSLCGYAAARTGKGIEAEIALAPHGRFSLSYGFAFSAATPEEAEGALSAALATHDPFAEAEERFNLWMEENAPRLTLDDPDLLRVYYYRFFVIKCAVHTPSQLFADPIFPGRAVYESPFGNWFGCPIGLPIALQLEEMRWMKGTEAARDHIGAWCRALGHTQTYIQYTPMAIRRFCLERGDLSLMKEAYPACRAFTLCGLPPERAGELPITKGSWLTGAEYQPAFYQYTTPPWDWRYDNEGIRAGLADAPRRLLRADAAAMHLANLTAVRDMAERLGYRTDAALFGAAAAEAERTLTDRLYSREHRFFFDRDVERDALCDRAAGYAGFLPLLFGLLGDEYAHVLDALSEGRFAAGLTLTTVAKDCPMYWFDSHIVYGGDTSYATPHHYPSSWNGPIWPFAVSLVLSALGRAGGRIPKHRAAFLRLFAEYTELHFLGGERTLPCIVEHYRVGDGMPLSPYTEYFHSKWIDLFLSYFAGIGYEEGEVRFAPLTDVDFVLEGVMLGGKCYRFEQKHADGRLVRTATVMAP